MAMLEVKNLSKSFGSQTVLKDISFNVEKGDVLAIIGPSGSGKSTLLRCINQLEKASGGSVDVCGINMFKLNEAGKLVYANSSALRDIRLKIGLVFQNFNLFPHMNVLRNITEAPIRVLKKVRRTLKRLLWNFSKKWDFPRKLNPIRANFRVVSSSVYLLPALLRFRRKCSFLTNPLRLSIPNLQVKY